MKKLTKKDFTKDGFTYPFMRVIDEIQKNIDEVYDGMSAQMKQITFEITDGAYEVINGNRDKIIEDSRWAFGELKHFYGKIAHIVCDKVDGKWQATFIFE